jgi:hypothetical protein
MEPRIFLRATGHPQRAGEVVTLVRTHGEQRHDQGSTWYDGDQREEPGYDGCPYYDGAFYLQRVRLCRDNGEPLSVYK